MTTTAPDTPDEFAALGEAAVELGLDPAQVPAVARGSFDLGGDSETPGQRVSFLRWHDSPPELVLLHGGGQNAHTWDLVLLLLDRPAVAIDLPGHGHSSWRADRDYRPTRNAAAVAEVIAQLAPAAEAVIGMSLGGLTTIHLAATRPEQVQRAVIVDVTPGSPEAAAALSAAQRGAVQLTRGPRTFPDQDQMIEAAIQASPRRAPAAVRRGVVHNSRQLPDGTWTWRYDRTDPDLPYPSAELWDDVDAMTMPTMLVSGGASGFVTPGDRAEFARRLPTARTETVPDAGHAVHSDQPVALAGLIADFLAASAAERRPLRWHWRSRNRGNERRFRAAR